ncbi:MAG: hypothetical protein R3A80_09220 [Bdellovibrionota bacterium]
MLEVTSKQIPPSKSLYNRALVMQSFEPDLKIVTNSSYESEDVQLFKKALSDFGRGETEFYCGAGAAPFKFLAIRLSRQMGSFVIRGTERLLSRPLDELLSLLSQLGCRDVLLSSDSLSFSSSGEWPTAIEVNVEKSSQELSALILSSWELDEELQVTLVGDVASSTYLEMTVALMSAAGWSGNLIVNDRLEKVLLPKKQYVVLDEIFVEPDMSCIASLALAGAIKGGAHFFSMLPSSLQGDQLVFPLMAKMGVKLKQKLQKARENEDSFEEQLQLVEVIVEEASIYSGIEVDLRATPDLFPVLAAFSAKASTPSIFTGLKNLNIKESRRLDRMKELLEGVGVKCELQEDRFKVLPVTDYKLSTFDFDSDKDHRLAMAAALLKLQGALINLKNPEVVNKSFPNFWDFVAS